MPRLPQPGQDSGSWGNVLNDFLSQAHNPDGTLKAGSVTSKSIAPGAVTTSNLATTAIPEATPTTQGTIQLAGDLAGTATSPTVPGLATKADTATTYTKTQVDTALTNKLSTTLPRH